MRPRDRRIAILLACVGVLSCAWVVSDFFQSIVLNRLPWTDAGTAPEHYLAVGESYSRGFAVGFFLCFFLAIGALAVSIWARDRRRAVTTSPTPGRRREDRAALQPVDVSHPASPYPATARQ